MNERLRHPHSVYLRKMQMSRVSLYIFVEGYTDRYIYSEIADKVCRQYQIEPSVVTAKEINRRGGGKKALLAFFDFLKRKSSLINTFKEKTTVSLFFLDKDLDDFKRTKRRSENIVYTETYDIENYISMYGELCEPCAAAAALDVQSTRAVFDDCEAWRCNASTRWKDWVKLCFFSQVQGVNTIANYGQSASQINHDSYGSVDEVRYEELLSRLQEDSDLSPSEFERVFGRISNRIDRIYLAGHQDLVFKGKWYTGFLVKDIEFVAGGRSFNSNALGERLLSGIAQTLDFDKEWTNHFKEPMRNLLSISGFTPMT